MNDVRTNSRWPPYFGSDAISEKQQRIIELARAARDGQLGLLIGAGFSSDAQGLPLGTELAAKLVQETLGTGLADVLVQETPKCDDAEADSIARKYGLGIAAQRFLDECADQRDQLVSTLREQLKSRSEKESQPQTDLHSIVSNSNIKRIFTTNYDPLIENALGPIARPVTETISALREFDKETRRLVGVFHLYGTVESARITEEELRRPGIFLEELRHELISKTFVMLGYSFRDESIVHIFEEIRNLLIETKQERKTFLVSEIRSAHEYLFAKPFWDKRYGITLIPMKASAFLAELLDCLRSIDCQDNLQEISEDLGLPINDVKEKLRALRAVLPEEVAMNDIAEIARQLLLVRAL
jgi:hypothetical protein